MFRTMLVCLLAIAAMAGCGGPKVVVYTALDEMYSRPILDTFEKQTGIEVQAVYDTEASKTTGLVTRLLQEKNRPRADVFWNNELVQTVRLKKEDVLAPYATPAAEAFPARYKDPENYWTGFAARGRVIIYNTDLVDEPPTSILDFLDEKWRGRAAIANPLFGTTATHAAVLFDAWGDEEAKAFFLGLQKNEVAVLQGNATVRDRVAAGEFSIGLTDTDDANAAIEDGKPIKWLFPDQGPDELGALIIPNSVALINKAPHPDAARKLIDFLLSPEVEEHLANARSIQIPLNPAVPTPGKMPALKSIKQMDVDFAAAAGKMPVSAAFILDEFLE